MAYDFLIDCPTQFSCLTVVSINFGNHKLCYNFCEYSENIFSGLKSSHRSASEEFSQGGIGLLCINRAVASKRGYIYKNTSQLDFVYHVLIRYWWNLSMNLCKVVHLDRNTFPDLLELLDIIINDNFFWLLRTIKFSNSQLSKYKPFSSESEHIHTKSNFSYWRDVCYIFAEF